MINNYGYNQYKKQSVDTMTRGEMLILLYDEAIKRLTRAEYALKSQNYGDFEAAVQRTSDIIQYLLDTLDRSYPVSASIVPMYNFFLYELSRLRAGRKIEIIEELKPLIVDMRDTFKEADKLGAMAQSQGVI